MPIWLEFSNAKYLNASLLILINLSTDLVLVRININQDLHFSVLSSRDLQGWGRWGGGGGGGGGAVQEELPMTS